MECSKWLLTSFHFYKWNGMLHQTSPFQQAAKHSLSCGSVKMTLNPSNQYFVFSFLRALYCSDTTTFHRDHDLRTNGVLLCSHCLLNIRLSVTLLEAIASSACHRTLNIIVEAIFPTWMSWWKACSGRFVILERSFLPGPGCWLLGPSGWLTCPQLRLLSEPFYFSLCNSIIPNCRIEVTSYGCLLSRQTNEIPILDIDFAYFFILNHLF